MTADKRAVSRDETLRRLMAEYEIPIRRMCCIYLRDADLAADAVQDTFLKAYLALDQYRGEASEKTWLMRIAVNTCHSLRRSGWLRYIDRRIDLDKLPEPVVQAEYSLTELTCDIMRLPQKLLDMVLLHDYQGFTVREIGEMLDIPYQTATSRLQSARKKLRIVLTDTRKGGAPK